MTPQEFISQEIKAAFDRMVVLLSEGADSNQTGALAFEATCADTWMQARWREYCAARMANASAEESEVE